MLPEKGTLLEEPVPQVYLSDSVERRRAPNIEWEERLLRVGLGAPT